MGTILNWSSSYPATVDSIGTSFPTLQNNVHDVLASHVNELANAVVAIQGVIGGFRLVPIDDPLTPADGDVLTYSAGAGAFVASTPKGALTMMGAVPITTRTVENVLGSFELTPTGPVVFKAIGLLTVAALGDAEVRLYDLGTAASPIAPVLRSTITFPNADAGQIDVISATLTPVALPAAPNNNQIYNVTRIYEVRAILDPSAAGIGGDSLIVNWSGLI